MFSVFFVAWRRGPLKLVANDGALTGRVCCVCLNCLWTALHTGILYIRRKSKRVCCANANIEQLTRILPKNMTRQTNPSKETKRRS